MGINNTRVEVNGKPYWNSQLVANIIKWIHKNKSPGAILCFVSGWQDIIEVGNFFNIVVENCTIFSDMKYV